MPSTYSKNYSLELITTGERAGTWGAATNINIARMEAISGGVWTKDLSGVDHSADTGVPYIIQTTDSSAPDSVSGIIPDSSGGRAKVLIFNGTWGGFAGIPGDKIVQIEDSTVDRFYIVINEGLMGSSPTTPGHALLFRGGPDDTTGVSLYGPPVGVARGETALIYVKDGFASKILTNLVLTDLTLEDITATGTVSIGGTLTLEGGFINSIADSTRWLIKTAETDSFELADIISDPDRVFLRIDTTATTESTKPSIYIGASTVFGTGQFDGVDGNNPITIASNGVEDLVLQTNGLVGTGASKITILGAAIGGIAIEPNASNYTTNGGQGIIVTSDTGYINLDEGEGFGSSGIGIRVNSGTIEAKNADGAWGGLNTSGLVSGDGQYFEVKSTVIGASTAGDLSPNYLSALTPHSFGSKPRMIRCYIRPIGTPHDSYETSDQHIYIGEGGSIGTDDRGIGVWAPDNDNIRWVIGSGGIHILKIDAASKTDLAITDNSKWELWIQAWK